MKMADVTQVPKAVDLNELYRQKGELTTQMQIAQGRLQQVDFQIQQALGGQIGQLAK